MEWLTSCLLCELWQLSRITCHLLNLRILRNIFQDFQGNFFNTYQYLFLFGISFLKSYFSKLLYRLARIFGNFFFTPLLMVYQTNNKAGVPGSSSLFKQLGCAFTVQQELVVFYKSKDMSPLSSKSFFKRVKFLTSVIQRFVVYYNNKVLCFSNLQVLFSTKVRVCL